MHDKVARWVDQNRLASSNTNMENKSSSWVDQGYVVDVAYLDLSKAFDLVSHRLLLEKIGALGFDRVIIGWIVIFVGESIVCLNV